MPCTVASPDFIIQVDSSCVRKTHFITSIKGTSGFTLCLGGGKSYAVGSRSAYSGANPDPGSLPIPGRSQEKARWWCIPLAHLLSMQEKGVQFLPGAS